MNQGSARQEEGAKGGDASELRCGGLLGLAAASLVINLTALEPPPGLDKNAYFLAISGVFLAGMAQVFAAVCWVSGDRPRGRGQRKLKYASVAPLVVAIGLSVATSLRGN